MADPNHRLPTFSRRSTMRLIPFAIAVGMLTAAQPTAAQQRDGNGVVTMSTRTAQYETIPGAAT